ncbi:MAG TPA: PHP domain-containing protein [Verrucomicrobiae bacterium]|nr:PHP domain-containing protein [Verrucomicrobiae bacterium]
MKKHKLDLHVHSQFSADSVADPEEIVASAKKKGLQGIAITDHNTSECVDYYLERGLMRADGQPVEGFLIIPGQEITTSEGHLLALGVHLPYLKGISPLEAIGIIHEKGGIAIPPHPYDQFRAGIREKILDGLEIDAIEVFNAAATFRRYNRHAFEYALRRGLPMISASDAHHPSAVGTAFTILGTDDFSLAGTLTAIKRGGELRQRYLSVRDTLKKTFSNFIRLKPTRLARRARPIPAKAKADTEPGRKT